MEIPISNMEFSVGNTFGELYLGVVLATLLYGITLVQTYTYFGRYESDRYLLKTLVVLIFFLDTIHTGLSIYTMWYYLVDAFGGQMERLQLIVWAMYAHVFVSAIVATFVQVFYAWRIRALTNALVVPVFIVFFGIAQFGFDIYFIHAMAIAKTWTAANIYKWATNVSLGCSVVADLTIAVSMTLALRAHRSKFEKTTTLVNKIIMYAIGTGVLTSVACIITILTSIFSKTLFGPMVFFMISKLYANSFLVSLNSRKDIREAGNVSNGVSISLDSRPSRSRPSRFGLGFTSNTVHRDVPSIPGKATIHVNMNTHIHKDLDSPHDDV